MSNKNRASTLAALEKFSKKDLKEIDKINKPKRKNQKPEKLVEQACIKCMREQCRQVEVYESKATYNPRLGIYMQQAMRAGTCDAMGVLPSGIAVGVEFKAKGRISTFNKEKNHRQKEFIITRIGMNGFFCVVDSVERLKEIYKGWSDLTEISQYAAQEFLLKNLP